MKKTLLLFFCLAFLINSYSQYDPSNISKYYYYKERFQNNFIISGIGLGKSIPYSARGTNKNGEHVLLGGEHTFMLGNYIAFLGTEYRLFKDSKLNTDKTIEELFYALEAFNRLDYFAETYEKVEPKLTPDLNGFFIREDVPDGSLQNNPQINTGAVSIKNKDGYAYFRKSGQTIPIIKNADEYPVNEGSLEHAHMSQDHAIRMLWGLMLAYKCLDENIELTDENIPTTKRTFIDGETNFKKEVRNIFLRIVENFIANKDLLGQWHIKDAFGNNVSAGSFVGYKSEIKHAYKLMKSDFVDTLKLKRNTRTITGAATQIGMNDWMNDRMQLEARNLSGNSKNAWKKALVFGYEPYFINYGVYVHQWYLSKPQSEQLKKTTELYLNIAPCFGTFYHSENDYSQFGWGTPDRSERSFEDTYFGVMANGYPHSGAVGNFSGLDFLLMHNLFYLNNFKLLGDFKEVEDANCNVESAKVDLAVLDSELERVEERLLVKIKREKKACKKSSKREYSALKKDCKNRSILKREECVEYCESLTGEAKRECKKQCKEKAKKVKANCEKWRIDHSRDCESEIEQLELKMEKIKAQRDLYIQKS